MGSESGPPAKRLRASLNGNVQLTECVREFKLPRQYPSMVSKLHNDALNDRTKRSNFTTGVACIPRAVNGPKIIQNMQLSQNCKIRTIKLKGKDGKDLGEVNVQDLPHNIQGKTITIAKNTMKKAPESIPVTDKTKGITIGVLTPVNILKSDDIIRVQAEGECVFDESNDKTLKAIVMPKDPKKIATGVDSQGRPQVLVFQSGKKWHMVKFPNNALPTQSIEQITKNCVIDISQQATDDGKNAISDIKLSKDRSSQNTKNCAVGRSQSNTNGGKVTVSNVQTFNERGGKITKNCQVGRSATNGGKVTLLSSQSSKELQSQNVGLSGNIKSTTNSNSLLLKNKISNGINENRTLLRKRSQPTTPDSTTDRCKSKSPASPESVEQTKPKIEVSRIIGSSAGKQATPLQTSSLYAEICKPVTRRDTREQKDTHLGQDVMVALPSEKDNNDDVTVMNNDEIESSTNSDITEKITTPSSNETGVSTSSGASAWRRKLLSNKNSDNAKYLATRDIASSSRQTDKRIQAVNGEKKNEMTSNLSILEKALSTVGDEVLREKALKALADCGIGIERLVPVRPIAEQKPVKDSDTQTSIFGLWDSEQFINVPKDLPTIERIKITERTIPVAAAQTTKNVTTNPNSQDLYINGIDMPEWSNREYNELTNMVEGYVKGNDDATQVAAIFAKPSPVRLDIVEQLQKDFDDFKKYDENGFLNIHKAVIKDQEQSVNRHLMVLRACDESADLPTRDGQTSLELAIRYEASPKIVKALLDAGAEPTSQDPGHDSALLIASRQSIEIMIELISHVKTSKYLDNYDSTGFAALHYCTQNGYEKGVTALVRASADVNLCDRRSGRTPLFHAIENDYNDIAQMLLENGAEAGVPNYGGQTIFNVIDETKHFNLLEVLSRVLK